MTAAISEGPPGRRNSRGMSGHQSARSGSDTWLTPPEILSALGSFDMDPCAAPEPRPWPTARVMIGKADGDGLAMPWRGRVWLNPPYGNHHVMASWLSKMADHGCGTALIFARTETAAFHDFVWRSAISLLFLEGRLHFHRPDGTRAKFNAGAPSVLVAYGQADADRLAVAQAALAGAYVRLRG